MNVQDLLDLIIGLLEIVLSLVVVRRLWGFRSGLPWLMALALFFVLRGADRVVFVFTNHEPRAAGYVLDAMVIVLLVLLVFGLERIVESLELARDTARFREREYERALVDYRRLMRHRIANPLTAITGAVRTLRRGTRDQQTYEELLAIIDREAERLGTVSLDPETELAAEERDLQPRPSERGES